MSGDLIERIEQLIEPSIEAMGYELVRVSYGGGERPVLQIMAERQDRSEMTVENCAEISHAVSAILDVEDPIAGEYNLEVSSPGIDRPLTRIEDFERFAGFEARVELAHGLDGQKKFRGKLLGLDGDETILVARETGNEAWRLPVADVRTAKLVMTDELLKASMKASEAGKTN